ncbi:MAG: hypothetical protein WD425_17275 [Nitrospirales bacterium]
MTQQFKAKVAHIFDNGDKLELEAHVEADDHNAAFDLACHRFRSVVGELAGTASINIEQTKIEMNG